MSALDRQVGGSHYRSLPVQPGVFALSNRLLYFGSNATTYIFRHPDKEQEQALMKAVHCCEMADELGERSSMPPFGVAISAYDCARDNGFDKHTKNALAAICLSEWQRAITEINAIMWDHYYLQAS